MRIIIEIEDLLNWAAKERVFFKKLYSLIFFLDHLSLLLKKTLNKNPNHSKIFARMHSFAASA